jgi:hypothetical protein
VSADPAPAGLRAARRPSLVQVDRLRVFLCVALAAERGCTGHSRTRRARVLAVAWNVLGVLDIAMALALGRLTGFPIDRPMTVLPGLRGSLSVVPCVAVPACVLVHAAGVALLRSSSAVRSCQARG